MTAARVAALTAAITGFSNVMSTPRGQIVNRSALLEEVETGVAALLEKVSDMDDLVVQFDDSDAGSAHANAATGVRIAGNNLRTRSGLRKRRPLFYAKEAWAFEPGRRPSR